MPNGEMRKISDTRISIEVDNIAHVIDHPVDADVPLVVAEFMAQWAQKHKRDMKLIASKKLQERKQGTIARQNLIDELAGMSDEDVEQLVKERKPMTFGFSGFEPLLSEDEKKSLSKTAPSAAEAKKAGSVSAGG